MASDIFVGDTVQFNVTIKDQNDAIVDVSTATTIKFLFEGPDKSSSSKDGSFYTNGSDGIVKYTASTSDISSAGYWKYQVHIVLSNGNAYHSTIGRFRVWPTLPN